MPARSDDILVSSTGYNIRGEAVMMVDPAEKVTLQFYDDAGRRVRMVDNYVESGTDSDQNRTTTWEYNTDGQMIALSAINSITGIQVTQYQYGVSLAGSTVASNNLLHAVTYPDGGTVVYDYNRQGQRIQLTDQNATIHQYDYDLLGRQSQDRVTQVGLGIDAAVRRIAVSYDVRGLIYTVTSYDDPTVGSGTVLNQVLQIYRDFMQLGGMYQEHNGAASFSSLHSIYDYVDGSNNTARLYRYSFPDQLKLFTLLFGSDGSIPDRLSRPDYATAAIYKYLGLGTFVEATSLEYPHRLQSTLATGSGANLYASLDRFGRVINNQWTAYDDGNTMLDQIQYGYDRMGNRLWRYNVVAHTNSADFDELYSYDGLNQLADMQRGSFTSTPPSGFGSRNFQQTWTLDSTGNWRGFIEKAEGSTTSLDQTRDANRVNEIIGIANSTGGDWTQPVYDAAGNMTTMPQPGDPTNENGYTATYDAWNRLVRLMDGEDIVQENEYDGTTRRIIKKTYTSGTLSETRHYYYNNNWQVIAEYTGTTPVYSTPERIYFWGLRYIDELVSRYRSVSGSLDEYLRPLQDANWNVTALCDSTAAVIERYAYTAYGTTTLLDDTFTPLSPNASAYDWETLYCGYRFDAETGLYHVRFRELHSVVGMWLTRDPAKTSPNLYGYVDARAITLVDPSGLAKWEGPWFEGTVVSFRFSIYYGPWKCRQTWVDDCKKKCKGKDQAFRGCIWLADVKYEQRTIFGTTATEVGGYLAITHCCCDCPTLSKEKNAERRKQWDDFRDEFRKKFGEGWGEFPTDSESRPFPVHHVDDLWHGGDPVDPNNLLPVPPDVHKDINKAYPDCYAGNGGWDSAGPDNPYKP